MSWVKLSAVLAGLSGVLTLRINLDHATESQSLRAKTRRHGARVAGQSTTTRRARSKAKRRRTASHEKIAGTEQILFANGASASHSQLLTGHYTTSLFAQSSDKLISIRSQAPTGMLDTPEGSLAAGCVYFVVALLSLCIGTIDYLQRERAIEQIDVLAQAEKEAVDRRKQSVGAEAPSPHQGHGQDLGSGVEDGVVHNIRRTRERHLADEDFEQARSGKIVTIMTATVAFVVAASAVLLLVDERSKRPVGT
jgi:hypothetical protein